MNKTSLLWGLGGVAGVLLIVVVMVVLVSQRASTPTVDGSLGSTPAETSPPAEGEETSTAPPARQDVHLVGAYLRPGVEPHHHYLRVEQVLAGPTPCQEDVLLVLGNASPSLQWAPGDRLEVLGAYQAAGSTCRVVLDQPEHTLKTLPKPEPESEPPQVEPAAQQVRALATVSTVREGTAFSTVDQVLEGELPCAQVSFQATNPALVPGAQVELLGEYDPQGPVACQVTLADPLHDVRLIAPAPTSASPAGTTPSASAATGGNGAPFFLSGGVSYLDPIPLFRGSAGLSLTDQLKGMATVGFGSGQVKINLPSGEPIATRVQALLVEVAALMSVSGDLYLGASAGFLRLSGEYELPYPTATARFSAGAPLVGIVAGYQWGPTLLTVGVGIALGGR